MGSCLVSYQLTRDILKYDDFFNAVDEVSNGCNKQLFDGCILIISSVTIKAIREKLMIHLQPLDRLFVCKFRHDEIAGQLPTKTKKWIKENIIDKAPIDYSSQMRK